VADGRESYPSREAPWLEGIIEQSGETPRLGSESLLRIAALLFMVRCKTTNLPWEVSEAGPEETIQWSIVHLHQ